VTSGPPAGPRPEPDPREPLRLHVGAGRRRLAGWINFDLQPLPGVDVVADATRGLLFSDVTAIYAEHFLEHLRLDDAVGFLVECHRALAPGGVLRLSTPNLDWVWLTHYALGGDEDEQRERAIRLNRAFHGWRHRFLWNRETLARALAAAGFSDLAWCRYGESARPELRGLEGHDTYDDSAELPHVVIAEAVKGDPRPDDLAALRGWVRTEFLDHLAD
jgi:predicted SAM-dependent methyltransferase